jgi:hypothetical protein
MLKATDFFWLWIYWVSFACWFLVFLSCCYFFFFYSCTATTTKITTTITSNSVSKGFWTLEINYKLWSSKVRSFGRKKERAAPKFILPPTLGLRSVHTQKAWLQYKICTKWSNLLPCTWILRLTSGLCILVCFWACNHVVSCPCSNFGKKREENSFFKNTK